MEFFGRTPRGEVLQRCVEDAEALQSFGLETLPEAVCQLLRVAVALAVLARIHWPLGLPGVLVYSLYLIPLGHFGHLQRRAAAALRDHSAVLDQILLENLETVWLIQTFGTEEQEYRLLRALQDQWAERVLHRHVTEQMFRNVPRVLDALAPALVFAVGGWQVFSGRLTVGDLVAATGLLPAVHAPFRSLAATFLAVKEMGVRLERVVAYLALPPEPGRRGSLRPVERIRGWSEFRHVSYETDRGPVLSDVSFVLRPGEHVAIVGPSGAGKSTLAADRPAAGAYLRHHPPRRPTPGRAGRYQPAPADGRGDPGAGPPERHGGGEPPLAQA